MEKVKKSLFWIFALSSAVYFGQGIEGLPGQAFFYYLKETLKYNESRIMFISSLITVAWLIKPIIGYLVDSLKLSKRFWIISSLITSCIISIYLGISPLLSMPVIITLLTIANWNAAVRDVTVDGVMCIEGKKNKLTGKIQSVQWFAITVASLLCGVGGGWLAEKFNYQTCYLLLVPFYALLIFIASKYQESKSKKKSKESFWQIMKQLFMDKRLMLVCLIIFLYKFSPSFGTPLMFIERDIFHWSKVWIGTLATISAVMSMIGAGLYYHFSRSINVRKWLVISVFIGAITTSCYLYFTPTTDVIYTIVGSVIGMFIQLLSLDFMARNTQKGMEATSFALLCSVSNLAGTCNGFVGGWLFPIVGLNWLIIISAVTSFVCLPILLKFKFEERK